MKGGTILPVIWFSFVVSPCQSQINWVQLTDQATFPCKPLHPSKTSFPVIWCSTPLKTELGGWSGKKRQRHQPCYHHFIFDFFPIPFFNPSDEVWTGRSMLSQTAISLHHMWLTLGMAERRRVCRERSQEKGERRKIHNVIPRMGSSQGSLLLCDVLLCSIPSCFSGDIPIMHSVLQPPHNEGCQKWHAAC